MNWKLHTPVGTADILAEETLGRSKMSELIGGVFKSYGYNSVETPTLEFYDVFANNAGTIEQEKMFKFFDEAGRILVLRPDLTTPVARMAATKLKDEILPLRLSYSGNAYRIDHTRGSKQRQFTQSGIELIGVSDAKADAEVISVTIESFLKCGLCAFQIDIGQVEFFKGLCEQIGLSDTEAEELRATVDRKDFFAIERLLEKYSISDGILEIISSLPTLFGDISVIDRINKKVLTDKSLKALDNICEIYRILKEYGYEKYISVDLGMLQDLNYYTGLIFKGFAHSIGYPVCSGGRYDTLIGEFGSPLAATGVAIGLDRLMSACKWQESDISIPAPDALVAFEDGCAAQGKEALTRLQARNLVCEMYLNKADRNAVKKYAESKKIKTVIYITPDGEEQL